MNIYYLGPEGSYSYSLVKKKFPRETLIPLSTFSQIVTAVENDGDSLGVLGIENSISSSVHESIDLLFNSDVCIVGEACMDIQLHLIGVEGASVSDVQEVFSYPQAIAQCSQFIQKHHMRIHETPSTMAAVHEVDTLHDKTKAAIAGRGSLAATHLAIIHEQVGNVSHNMTRWVFISQKQQKSGHALNKMTFIFTVKHQPGSLVKVLQAIADARGNMSKIESRPVPGSNWEYSFWIDIEIPEGSVNMFEELMKQETLSSRIVGVYESGETYSE